jgi:hypothetical protein
MRGARAVGKTNAFFCLSAAGARLALDAGGGVMGRNIRAGVGQVRIGACVRRAYSFAKSDGEIAADDR